MRSWPLSAVFLAGNQPEQGRLARAVGSDDPDDPAWGQREFHVLEDDAVAVALAHAFSLDGDIAQPWPRRNVELYRLVPLHSILVQQFLVGPDSRLVLLLLSPRRHANPLQLALQRPLSFALALFFQPQALLFLL